MISSTYRARVSLFYLNLDTSAANHIVFSAFDAKTEFFHLIIYIGFYFHNIIRYKDLDGIENLLAAQQKILQNGADSLAENGRLVYSTCTVNDKENQAQVEKFLSSNPDFHVVLPKTAVPGADITPLGTLFLPHRTGTDGFFAAILERN